MKLKVFLFLVIILFLNGCGATLYSSSPEKIDTYVKEVDPKSIYVKCEDSILGLTTEGTSLDSYYNRGELVKLEVVYYKETGKTTEEIYLRDSQILFIKELDTAYAVPLYDENFDIAIAETIPSQYYFQDQQLVSWIKDGATMNPQSEEFAEASKRLLGDLEGLDMERLIHRKDCANSKKENPKPLLSLEELNQKKEQCLAQQKTIEAQYFGRYLKDENDRTGETEWVAYQDTDSERIALDVLSIRKGQNLRDVVFESSTPSGDWYRVDDYCFNRDGSIVSLYSDFRTLQGEEDMQVIRTWLYDSTGVVLQESKKIISLDTEEPLPPDSILSDNPPYLVSSFEDLLEKIEFLESGFDKLIP